MADPSDVLRAQQRLFADHLRDPALHPAPPGLEERRLQIYRDLFFRSFEGLLSSGFPVARAVLGDAAWTRLLRDFYREHPAHTPLFPRVGEELLDYLAQRAAQARGDPPWLLELCHYEWVEAALLLSDADRQPPPHDPQGDLLDGIPVRAPLAWPLAYRYAVHRIRADARPEAPGDVPTCLLVLRDAGGRVRFREITPVILQLLKAFEADDAPSGRTALRDLATQAGADVERFVADGAALLQRLRDDGVLLGTRPRG